MAKKPDFFFGCVLTGNECDRDSTAGGRAAPPSIRLVDDTSFPSDSLLNMVSPLDSHEEDASGGGRAGAAAGGALAAPSRDAAPLWRRLACLLFHSTKASKSMDRTCSLPNSSAMTRLAACASARYILVLWSKARLSAIAAPTPLTLRSRPASLLRSAYRRAKRRLPICRSESRPAPALSCRSNSARRASRESSQGSGACAAMFIDANIAMLSPMLSIRLLLLSLGGPPPSAASMLARRTWNDASDEGVVVKESIRDFLRGLSTLPYSSASKSPVHAWERVKVRALSWAAQSCSPRFCMGRGWFMSSGRSIQW
mmetsp:Transcript_44352/g.111046  ORF Transcript_44352/g.111046 Transcript_44352/m.111046 type:complete len:313 (-) Transcript_44352:273-1211(-)